MHIFKPMYTYLVCVCVCVCLCASNCFLLLSAIFYKLGSIINIPYEVKLK